MDDSKIELQQTIKAARLMTFVLAVGLSTFAFFACWSIRRFDIVFKDMLGEDAQLPAITKFVTTSWQLLVALSVANPIFCIIALYLKDAKRSIYVMGGLGIASVVVFLSVMLSLFMPMYEIVERMNNPK